LSRIKSDIFSVKRKSLGKRRREEVKKLRSYGVKKLRR
jgi:hypothetical protein